jgi:Fur family ferric uptake transcriptional regulator
VLLLRLNSLNLPGSPTGLTLKQTSLIMRRHLYLSMPQAESKCAKQRFLEFLSRKNLRVTAQRRAIIDTAFSTRRHFTAEELLEWSRLRDKSVSRATVYRTLPLLTESGLVAEMDFGKQHKFYDPNYAEHPRHNHIVCQDCQKIVEFESEKLEQLETEISRRLGFSVQTQRVQITASCEELKQQGTCSKKDGEPLAPAITSSRGQ